jgi:hypothetical protein
MHSDTREEKKDEKSKTAASGSEDERPPVSRYPKLPAPNKKVVKEAVASLSKEKSVIIYTKDDESPSSSSTARGKKDDHIAVFVKEFNEKHAGSTVSKKIAILEPTVPLVKNMFDRLTCLEEYGIRTKQVTADSDAVDWTAERWNAELKEYRIVVTSPTLFLDTLEAAPQHEPKLQWDTFDLIILDECHHATGSHPYVQLMGKVREVVWDVKETDPALLRVVGVCMTLPKGKKRDDPMNVKDKLRKTFSPTGAVADMLEPKEEDEASTEGEEEEIGESPELKELCDDLGQAAAKAQSVKAKEDCTVCAGKPMEQGPAIAQLQTLAHSLGGFSCNDALDPFKKALEERVAMTASEINGDAVIRDSLCAECCGRVQFLAKYGDQFDERPFRVDDAFASKDLRRVFQDLESFQPVDDSRCLIVADSLIVQHLWKLLQTVPHPWTFKSSRWGSTRAGPYALGKRVGRITKDIRKVRYFLAKSSPI